MAHTTTSISAPVSIYDVQQVLGISGNGDLGTLIAQGNINMWSRHKPVAYPSVKQIGFGDSDGSNEAKTVNYGIQPGRVTINDEGIETSDVTDLFEMAEFDWQYAKPTGGSQQPFRLTDFKGYSHDAVPFIVVEGVGDISINTAKHGALYVRATLDPGNSYENLQSYDFEGSLVDLNDWFLTVMINDRFFRAPAHITDADAGSEVEIDLGGFATGHTYPMYVFLGRYLTTGGQVENRCKGCMKLPTASRWNQFPVNVTVYYNSQEGGGGVPDARDNVWILPQLGYDNLGWKVLDSVTDDGDAPVKYRFINNNRSLVMKLKIQNTDSTAGQFTMYNFRAANVESGVNTTPELMYVSDTQDGTFDLVTSFEVPAGTTTNPGVKYAIVVFTQADGIPFMKGTSGVEEVYFYIKGHCEFYDTLNYRYGTTPAWEQTT